MALDKLEKGLAESRARECRMRDCDRAVSLPIRADTSGERSDRPSPRRVPV